MKDYQRLADLRIEELQERVWLLEATLRDIHKANAEEVDQSFDNAVIETLFDCAECLDTKESGTRPEDGAPYVCTACQGPSGTKVRH